MIALGASIKNQKWNQKNKKEEKTPEYIKNVKRQMPKE
jgi:hypothetical protein